MMQGGMGHSWWEQIHRGWSRGRNEQISKASLHASKTTQRSRSKGFLVLWLRTSRCLVLVEQLEWLHFLHVAMRKICCHMLPMSPQSKWFLAWGKIFWSLKLEDVHPGNSTWNLIQKERKWFFHDGCQMEFLLETIISIFWKWSKNVHLIRGDFPLNILVSKFGISWIHGTSFSAEPAVKFQLCRYIIPLISMVVSGSPKRW